MKSKTISQAVRGQKTWIEYERQDLRHLDDQDLLDEEEIINACDSQENAISLIHNKLNVKNGLCILESPIGKVVVHESTIPHIVEKRRDARERYLNFAISTILNPYEIYDVEYDDGSVRRVFIGAFKGKRQMLAIAVKQEGEQRWLWNFMHCDAKKLNKHRNGHLVYSRN